MQTNEYAVPNVVSVFGKNFHEIVSNGTTVTELYIAAAKHNEKMKNRDNNLMVLRIAENQLGFTVVRARFTNVLTSYYNTFRITAADILHLLFSTPRGASGLTSVMHDKLDAVHEMLGLQRGQALLDTTHPVCMEYDAVAGGSIRRLFPSSGNSMTQVFTKHNDPASQTALFLAAIGELRILLLLMYCVYLCCFVGRPYRELEVRC